MTYFIGIDSSTTATKALIMDGSGKVVGVVSNEYPYDTPKPLWSEQDPALWWIATAESIRQVVTQTGINIQEIKGIGLTGQMHGLVLLDENNAVLHPALLWNDQRTGSQCDDIRSKLGKEKLIQITGNDALTGFTAPKILWVQQNEPEIWKRTRKILLPKDYVRFKLTGVHASDRAGGAGTLLFDLANRDWSPEVLQKLNIPAEYMPPTFEGTEETGTLSASVANELGLPAGIPVYGGGGDQAASAVGTGAVQSGVVSLSLGTSGVVFATTDNPAIEPNGRLHSFCHSVPGKWHFMGVMLSAAGSLRWHRDTFAPQLDWDALLAPTAEINPGSDGLFFLPYLTGERTPYPDPLARGAFVGLTVRHSFPHLTRAVLEGVSFGLRDSFELMKAAGLADISQVRITGGGAKSPLWRQILADILGAELVTINTSEGAAYGAALLAAAGSGHFSSVEAACETTIKITGSTSPGSNQAIYEEIYPLYRALYPALRPTFNAIGS
ncbi:MAG: xylulokinase [Anaerolineaceae bacterium]|nr:xylulokinase [Anaerolineaceae bacterium]